MTANVLLLRSPSDDGGPDQYEEAFRAQGYRAVSVPVLETVHKNLDKLAEVLRRRGTLADRSARYCGVIVTSGRACEAWQAVVQELSNGNGTNATDVQGEHGRFKLSDAPSTLTCSYRVVLVYGPLLCCRRSDRLCSFSNPHRLPGFPVRPTRHTRGRRIRHRRETRKVHPDRPPRSTRV